MKMTPFTLALGLFIVAILLHMAVFSPMSDSLTVADAEMSAELARQERLEQDITNRDDLVKRIAELKQEKLASREKLINPMLNSYSMRAKSFLDVMAHEAGLLNVEYDEGGYRALPLPDGIVPNDRTGRRLVKVKAIGDYAAIVSFIMRAEHELPMMTLHSLSISQPKEFGPDEQKAEMIVEWPCEGEVIK